MIGKARGYLLLMSRGLRQFPLRSFLTTTGIATGVAVFVAIQLANEGILASFQRTINAVAGRSTLQITAGELGVDETLLLRVRGAEGVAFAAPLILNVALVDGRRGEALLAVGVDLLAEEALRDYRLAGRGEGVGLETLLHPETLFLSRPLAEAHHLQVGATITLLTGSRRKTFTVQGLLAPRGPAQALEGHLALMDIATAQAAFDKVGRLDRIDIIAAPGVDIETLQARLQTLLPSHLTVERPDRRNAQVEKMLAAFRLNLNALGAISLVVAMFLVYNTVSLGVIQRRPQVGILRSLGLTGWQVAILFLGEAMVLGLIGALGGLGLGYLLAASLLDAVSRTVSELYAYVRASEVPLPSSTPLLALTLGLGVSCLGALYPGLQAGRVSVREALHPALTGERRSGWYALPLMGFACFAGAYLSSRQGPVGDAPLFGYLALVLLILGGAFLTPGAALLIARIVRASGGRDGGRLLVASHLERHLPRNAGAVASMMTALAMLIGVAIMIDSFRRTVTVWVEETVRADLIVTPASRFTKGVQAVLPAELLTQLQKMAGVAAVDPFRGFKTDFRGRQVLLAAGDFRVGAERGRLLFLQGDSSEVLRRAKDREGIIISETVALTHGIREGDRVTLGTPKGPMAFPVVGVFYDYTTDGGKIVMDRSLFLRHWGDQGINVLAVYLESGADRATVERRIKEAAGEAAIFVMRNQELKRKVLEIFDNTFAVTYALRMIAIIVAAFGIVNTLWASVLERQREIGILRSVGASRGQVFRIVLQEAGLLGLLAELLGAVIGLFLSLVLIHVINKQSFGWSILFSFPPSILLSSLLLVLATALLAGYLPALRASRLSVVDAIRHE